LGKEGKLEGEKGLDGAIFKMLKHFVGPLKKLNKSRSIFLGGKKKGENNSSEKEGNRICMWGLETG